LSLEDAKKHLSAAGLADVEATPSADGKMLTVRTGSIARNLSTLENFEHRIKSVLEKELPGTLSSPFPFKTSIGASVAESLKYRAVLAILLSLLAIVVYLAFRFELKMGIAAALCLFHDVLVVVGVMMLLDVTSKWTGIDAKQNLQTIAAYLTIVGYSISDTIITFDRMRENLSRWDPKASKETYEAVLERSINETFGRTILTSFTVVLVLVVLALAGVKSLEGFTLALLAGVIFGTYSSIVIATPILLVQPRKLVMICAAELAYFITAAIVGGHLRL
jgi:preprotein translocase SecF subunit